jgi:secreted trypsin-like serine protease
LRLLKRHSHRRIRFTVASALCGACTLGALIRSAVGDTLSSAAGVGVSREALTGATPPSDFQPLFVGALLSESTGGGWSYHCSGTLVSSTVVVTAAHCLPASRADATMLGFTTESDIGEPPQPSARGIDVLVHEQFEVGAAADGQNFHDIGLLVLDHGLSGPIASLEDSAPPLAVGALLDVAAYGVPSVDGAPGLRRAGRVPVSSVIDTEIVAGSDDVEICAGDSGGGAFRPGSDVLAAIVSRGSHADARCDPQTVFTRVDVHRAWLEAGMAEFQRTGGGNGCSLVAGPIHRPLGELSILALVLSSAVWRRRRKR